MQAKTSTLQRWQFSAAVLLPVVLALVITAAAVLAFVFWTTTNIDQRAVERQQAMLQGVMATRRGLLVQQLGTVATRNDTVVNAGVILNFQWVDANLGKWLHDVYGHDLTVVLDAAGHPLYIMENGVTVEQPAFEQLAAPLRALIDDVRAMPVQPTTAGHFAPARALSDLAVIDGMPAMIGVMAISSATGTVAQSPGTQTLLAGIKLLDQQASDYLSREFMFENGHFSLTRPDDEARAVFPVFSNSGRFVAFFEWDRDRPGLMMLRHMGPALLAAFIIAAVLVFLLLRQLRQSSAAIEAGRKNAEYQAAHDRLTGLPNRASLDGALARALTEQSAPNSYVALLMLDLDRFKQVNDTLGHQAGDELICAVGRRIRTIVGPDVLIARLGGDEFVVMIEAQEYDVDPTAVASRIIDTIGKPFDLQQFKAHVGASIGIVSAVGGNAEPRELMRKADIALYEAKSGGRNRAVVYEEHMNELVQLQHTIEGELREALQREDQLNVVFQPLVDQHSREVIGAEALARWHHPKFGHISPARFIPVAEATGLIDALGEFVLRRACALGATAPGRTIAVNISPTQLRNPRFANQVFDILRQSGMQPADLELEITESILLDDEHVSAQHLKTFRAAGIHIALDDFGTGYSSLSYLKRYPVDRIKIDRSFVMQLSDGHVSVAITQAIVTLAHAMDLEVTAEGVETEEQAFILSQLGCNTLQGFLFSGGVAAERISTLFAAQDTPAKRRSTTHAA
ncbi:EAL domain-containing protein [Devosia sp. YR412]|uniref:putative bifunctional diguanylate cyclase/phosphodiesterase n=1 Tax=Devosia sp. YR412 TaxID=1881030 RepID=UPI00147F2687|nr:EAL domain-containing protein [Devosia sp. YR412]